MRDLIAEMMDLSSTSAVKRSGKRDLIAEMGGEIPRLPDVSGENSNPSWWEDQMKPTLMETGKQIFEIPKSLGEVGLTAATGAAGWLVGSGLGIAESLKPGSTRESVRAVAEDAAGRLTYQPRTEPAKILMEKAGRGIEALTGPAKEAASLPGESWNSPFLESVLKFAGEMATFEAMGAAGRIKPKVPDWYRMMTVKERGIVEAMKVDLANGEFTGAELRELWKDPANRAELLKRYQGVGKAERSAEPMRASGADVSGELPAGQGFEMRPRPGEVRDIIAEMGEEGPKALPAGQGFATYPTPESSPFSPELASDIQTASRKALPPGQGFELRPRPDEVRDILAEMQSETKQIGLDPGTGEGFTSVPGTPEAPIVTKAGEPFKSEQTALRAKGLDWNLYEVTPVEGGGFAITRKIGQEFKAKGEPPKMVLRGTEMVEAGTPAPPMVETSPTGAGDLSSQPEIVQPRAISKAKPEGIKGVIKAGGGINVYDDYNAPELRQFPDMAAVMKRSGPKPDEWAAILNDEGIKTPDGQPFTGDSLIEYLKSGQARDILTPEKQDLIIERRLRRQENEWISQQLANLEAEGFDAGATEASSGDVKADLIEAAKAEGYTEAEAIDALDFPFGGSTPKPEVSGELPGISARETFSLSNPETEIGTLQPKGNATPTKGFDFGSERGSTGDLSESEILQAILKTRGKIEQAMPHIEALGRSVFESGKQTFLDWQAAIKTRLGDLWENFKGYLKGVWERLQSGAVGPMKNDRGSVGVDVKAPQKSIIAYKLFRTMKTRPGEIFPLFIGNNIPTPIGKWVSAEFIPTAGFSPRPGWHVGRQPNASHLMKKDGTMPPDRVWAEVEIPADKDWQPIADKQASKDIRGEVPSEGFYRFKRPSNQGGEWLISGSMKVNRILSTKEVIDIQKTTLQTRGPVGSERGKDYGPRTAPLFPKAKPSGQQSLFERQKLIGSERGSTGDLSESEILQAILKTRGKIEQAMPHIEALGRSVFESGKQTFLDWQAAIKTRLGDLWENFKGYLKGVWERLQSGAVGPMKNDRGSFSTKVKDEVRNVVDDVKQTADEYLGAISTRLGNIDPSLRNTLRAFEFKRGMESARRTKQVLPFLEKVKKMSPADREGFDLARKNGNAPVLRTMATKYGMGKEYHELRNVLAEMHKAAVDVGYDVGFQPNYHPRVLKDTKGFLRYFYKQNDWPILEKAIRAKEAELQRYLSDEEKAKLLNTMLRGYPSGTISLSKPGQLKAREIAKVTTDLNQFYMDSDGALLRYINDVTDAVEARKLFGKGPKGGKVGNLNDTIGGYVLDLLQKGKIKPEQEQVLKDILDARFNEVGTRGVFGLYKNLSYIDTMGSPISAVTQIGDLAWALYKNGPLQTVGATANAITGKSLFRKEDIGIERIASEFGDTSKAARAVDKVFRLTGLTAIDNIGKESLINSAYNAARAKTMNPAKEKQLRSELEPIFEKETDQLIKDLKAGNITENVKLYLFNVLSDFQPISLSEMPQKYLTGGNGRIFYMLKTFTLKQFDIYRREIFQKIAKEGSRLEGIKNLVYLTSAFVAANAGADFIKDFILGRPIDIEDKVVDNFLRLLGISKFVTWKAREEGVGSAMVRQIAPPFKAVDALSKDINKAGDEKGLEITQSIPVVGKLYYWWFGKGAEKSEKKAKAAGGGRLVNPKLKGLSSGQLKALK